MTNWMLQGFLLLAFTAGFLYFSPFSDKKDKEQIRESKEERITERYVSELQTDLKRVDTEIVQTQTKLKDLGKEKKSIVKLLKSLTDQDDEITERRIAPAQTFAEISASVEQIAREISTAGQALAFNVKEVGKDRELVVNGDAFMQVSNGRALVSSQAMDAFFKAAQLVSGSGSMNRIVIVSRNAEAGGLERLQKFADAMIGVREFKVDVDVQSVDPQKPKLEMVVGFGAN